MRGGLRLLELPGVPWLHLFVEEGVQLGFKLQEPPLVGVAGPALVAWRLAARQVLSQRGVLLVEGFYAIPCLSPLSVSASAS